MTNDEFNALDPVKIGQIVEAHNSELILRMKDEMPKWIQIQNDFIEATVKIEIAKANRTPSAFREIFEAFTAGFTEQQTDDFHNFINLFTDAGSKLLAFFGLGSASPPSEEPPAEEPPSEEPPAEEPPSEPDAIDAVWDPNSTFKQSLTIQYQPPIAGFTKSYTTPILNRHGHEHHYLDIQNGTFDAGTGGSTDTGVFLVAYRIKIEAFGGN